MLRRQLNIKDWHSGERSGGLKSGKAHLGSENRLRKQRNELFGSLQFIDKEKGKTQGKISHFSRRETKSACCL